MPARNFTPLNHCFIVTIATGLDKAFEIVVFEHARLILLRPSPSSLPTAVLKQPTNEHDFFTEVGVLYGVTAKRLIIGLNVKYDVCTRPNYPISTKCSLSRSN